MQYIVQLCALLFFFLRYFGVFAIIDIDKVDNMHNNFTLNLSSIFRSIAFSCFLSLFSYLIENLIQIAPLTIIK